MNDMFQKINTALLVIVVALLAYIAFGGVLSGKGRFQPISDSLIFALDIKTGETCVTRFRDKPLPKGLSYCWEL